MVYDVICMNKFMNNHKIEADSAIEAMEIFLLTDENGTIKDLEEFIIAETKGYKFMIKK